MVKVKKMFVCDECGFESPRWTGKCPDCGNWNTLTEKTVSQNTKKPTITAGSSVKTLHLSEITSGDEIRHLTNISEFDRVLGGGIVLGSVVLISGDPGIGKSTLLLQMCQLMDADLRILYVTGEESARQIKLRALRLGVKGENIYINASTDLEQIIASIDENTPDIVIIDSIQTMTLSELSSSAGSITQIRESAQKLISIAKIKEIPIFLVGHVNKDGAIAGPKILEHMVDTVLYFEGERNHSYRILRAIKNRYGSTNEIGIFEMLDNGLFPVANPSLAMLSGRPEKSSGSCVTAVIEGSRPILSEIQALVSKSSYPVPKRSSNGVDFNRLSMLLAVLEKRCGYYFGNLDVYVNVVGGLRLEEPSADLAIILALISNLLDKPLSENTIAFGEIGLAGELRAVNRIQSRINEAYRLGFKKVLMPKLNSQNINLSGMPDLELKEITSVKEIKGII